MQFKFFALAAIVGLAVAAPQVAQRSPELAVDHHIVERQSITANTVIASINTISDIVDDALRIATSLNPFLIIPAIPRLVANFGRIVTAVGTDVTAWLGFQNGDREAFSVSAQRDIRAAFTRFVEVWIRLLETIVRVFGFLAGTPFILPFTTIIQVLARGVIGFARAVVGFVPEFKQEATQQQMQLEQSFTVVIERFN